MKYSTILLFLLSFVLTGCSDNNDEPKPDENKLIGYWAITHTKIIEHIGDGHNTFDKEVPPHGIDSTEGQIEYNEDLEKWNNDVGKYIDKNLCPVGSYNINGNKLIIGSLDMGEINFISDNEFTLEYKKSLNNSTDYKRLIYTYSRIHSLNL